MYETKNDELELANPLSASEQFAATKIQADPGWIFEPWFQSRRVSYEIKALKSVPERRVWTVYFDKWWCLVCSKKRKSHTGNGMCSVCYPRIWQRHHALQHQYVECGAPQTLIFDNEDIARRALAAAQEVLRAAATQNEEDNDKFQLAKLPSTSDSLARTEINVDRDSFLRPLFRSPRVSYQIRTLKSVPESRVWSIYFKKWGCLACGTKRKTHECLGMCGVCHQRISRRLNALLRPYADAEELQTFTFDNEDIARRALAGAKQTLLAAPKEDQGDKT